MNAPSHQQIDEQNTLSQSLREIDTLRGLQIAESAYAQACEIEYLTGQIDALVNQSYCNCWLGEFALALSQSLRALKLLGNLPDHLSQDDLFFAIARAQTYLANFDEGILWAYRAQLFAQSRSNTLVDANAFNLLGVNHFRLGSYEQALEAYQKALMRYQSLENHIGVCKVFINTAEVYSKQLLHEQALKSAQKALQLARKEINHLFTAYGLHTVGQMYANQGSYAKALKPLHQSIMIAREVGSQYIPLVSTFAIGQVYLGWQKADMAQSYFERSLELAHEFGNKLYVYRAHESLSALYESQGDWQKALAHYKEFFAAKEIVFNEQNISRIQSLEIMHELETARKEAEFYQQRNTELEREIARRIDLEKKLKEQAATDALTGITNRRRFIELAEIEIARALRHNRPLTLAVIDIDQFKQINDTHGHVVGDKALITLVESFKTNIRPTDIFARFGGDEFLLLLPDTSGSQARELIERIRALLPDKIIQTGATTISVAVSAGITSLSQQDRTLGLLLARADDALYQAKRNGRNAVVLIER
jgi:diguanylate cyclase (GGDEF)-like protein